MDDIRAVMDATGCDRAPLLGVSEGGALSILFASMHPERVTSLVLYGSYARKLAAPDSPWGVSQERLARFQASFDEAWATGRWWDIVNPDAVDDPASREWWARYLRVSASPGMAKQLMRVNAEIDVRSVLGGIDVPTLIVHRRADRWVDFGNATYLSDHIPGAKLVELEGSDHRPWLEDADAVLEPIESFVTGGRPSPRHVRTKLGAEALSRREREIAQLATDGQSTQEIARGLFISERTVESHLANAYVKLGVHTRIELVRRARELGL